MKSNRGVTASQVNYTFPEELGTPILQISEARKAKAYHKIAPGMDHQSSLKEGQSMEGALKGCQHQIRGGRWTMPSQLHFYMEPQTALAQGDGEGGMEVQLLLCIFALTAHHEPALQCSTAQYRLSTHITVLVQVQD